MKKKKEIQSLNIDNFRGCVDNDFQVYLERCIMFKTKDYEEEKGDPEFEY